MSDKEQINTIISMGVSLPPVNPDLDDISVRDIGIKPIKKGTRQVNKKIVAKETVSSKVTSTNPDPKEYVAELERPENVGLY